MRISDWSSDVCSSDLMHARGRAAKEKAKLSWTPAAPREAAVQFPSSRFELSPVAKKLGVTDPAQIYPLYEMATQAAWQQTPAQAQARSEEHTSELQSLMRISYAVFCLKKKKQHV